MATSLAGKKTIVKLRVLDSEIPVKSPNIEGLRVLPC